MKISVIHIGKTGGTAIKAALGSIADPRIALHGHADTLRTVWKADPSRCVVFGVRDPVSRYISGFNSRLRKGRPRRDNEWSPGEAEVFSRFQTPNTLAEALSSSDDLERSFARLAMHSINHVKTPLTYWLKGVQFLERHSAQILFVWRQATLSNDWPLMLEAMRLPYVPLPDGLDMHRAPEECSVFLSETGRANIEAWYAGDYELYEFCLGLSQAKSNGLMTTEN